MHINYSKVISLISTTTIAIGISSSLMQTLFIYHEPSIQNNNSQRGMKQQKPFSSSELFVNAYMTPPSSSSRRIIIPSSHHEARSNIAFNSRQDEDHRFKRKYPQRLSSRGSLLYSSASSLEGTAASPEAANNVVQQNNDVQLQQQQQALTMQQPQQQQQQGAPTINYDNSNQSNIPPGGSLPTPPPSELPPPPPPQPIDTFTLPPNAASTIDGRLLCASQCAYSITQPYFKSSAFRPATTAKRLTKGVNSVIIGHTIDGICIAFRGTQSTSPLDWLQNSALFLSNVGGDSLSEKAIKGKVHTGFYRGTKSLWKPLKGIMKDMIEESRLNGWKDDVYFTGHSKGGAMATVAAVLMKRDSDLPDPAYVCTFASAKVGDSEFCIEYNKNINQTSYEAHLDLIPLLPPSSTSMDMMSTQMKDMLDSMLWSDTSIHKKEYYKWDYQTVGKRIYIDENYQINDNITKELDEKRIKEFEKYSFLSIDEFKAAHCASCPGEDCDGYYFNAVAANVCEDHECTTTKTELKGSNSNADNTME